MIKQSHLNACRTIIKYHSDDDLSFGDRIDSRAIINVTLIIKGRRHPFTLWTSHVSHHHGLVRFQVSDRKLVKHTTEMILWSMILPYKTVSENHICYSVEAAVCRQFISARRPSRDSRYAAFLCTHCASTLFSHMCENSVYAQCVQRNAA